MRVNESNTQGKLGIVCALVLLDFMSAGFVGPQTPGLVKTLAPTSSNYGEITGVILVITATLQLLCAPILGALSDHFGRRPIFILSLVGLALANLMRGLADDLGVFLIGTIISGVTSATSTVAFATVSDTAAPERRAKEFGRVSAALGAGFVLGPVLGGILVAKGAHLAFLAAAAVSTFAAVVAFLFLSETRQPAPQPTLTWARVNPLTSLGIVRSGHEVLPKLYASFVLQSAIALFPGCFAVYAAAMFGWGGQYVGFGMGFLAAIFVLAQGLLVGPMVNWLGKNGASMAAIASGVAGFILLATAKDNAFVVLAMFCIGLSATAQPAIRAALSEGVPPEVQGELQGCLQAVGAVSRVFGPTVFTAGYVLGGHDYLGLSIGLPFIVIALLLGAAGILICPPSAWVKSRNSLSDT